MFTGDTTLTLERSARVPAASLWTWREDSARVLMDAAADSLTQDAVIAGLYGPLYDQNYEDVTAVVTHTAGFATIADTYGVLGAWVARNATADASAPICELYPTIAAGSRTPDIPVEIRWPITELTGPAAPAGPQ